MIISNKVHDLHTRTSKVGKSASTSSAKTKQNKPSKNGLCKGVRSSEAAKRVGKGEMGSRTKYLVTIVPNYTTLTEKIIGTKTEKKRKSKLDDDAGICQAGGLEWLLHGRRSRQSRQLRSALLLQVHRRKARNMQGADNDWHQIPSSSSSSLGCAQRANMCSPRNLVMGGLSRFCPMKPVGLMPKPHYERVCVDG